LVALAWKKCAIHANAKTRVSRRCSGAGATTLTCTGPDPYYAFPVSDIEAKLRDVRARIEAATEQAGRAPGSVRLVAVSKTKSEQHIRAAYAAGQRDFGENYVQELAMKAAALSDLPDLAFHFIGHLQRNKAKAVAKVASAIHSVDSRRLAAELGKRVADARSERAARGNLHAFGATAGALAVMAEVNVGGEAQKTGIAPEELGGTLDAIDAEPGLRLVGLMTVPPHTEDAAGARRFFDALVALRDQHGGPARLPELSMGMTHDLEHAIMAGATLVRVGTAIFGER
jgi:pyridoxal phosphate enzyme (YggS family)